MLLGIAVVVPSPFAPPAAPTPPALLLLRAALRVAKLAAAKRAAPAAAPAANRAAERDERAVEEDESDDMLFGGRSGVKSSRSTLGSEKKGQKLIECSPNHQQP